MNSYVKIKSFPMLMNLFFRYKSTKNVYSKTLNLPNAGNFNLSMKNIYENEENIKKLCNFESIYKWQENEKSLNDEFILHDGPPYANGDIHIGHMVNKVLKDVYLRYKLLSGYKINYKPGWDCHGLPIELNALKNFKKSTAETLNPQLETRKIASTFAKSHIHSQMQSFKQLNLIADWSNIYRTIDPEYMCKEIDLFYDLYKKKLIFRDYMPVYWSISSKTALAEFELEYNAEHKSEAVFVQFEINQITGILNKYLKLNQKLFGLIWTTTPWSLPGNKAIAYNPNLSYNLISIDNDSAYLVEKDLTDSLISKIPKFSLASVCIQATISGQELENLKYINPFTFQDSSFLPSDHVTSKQGTGLVHIAPAFGHDDFKLALKHNLKTTCLIDENGFYSQNDNNLQKLKLNGKNALDESTIAFIKNILGDNLLHTYSYVHSYPYDWRTKKPVIIRSSQQWFIDTQKLKDRALEVIKNVKIRPQNIVNSMTSTLANRSYWCISRQRVWGLPIPCLIDSSNDSIAIINDDLIENFKSLIRKDKNADFWWTNKYDELLNAKNYEKSKDILDIWFDSGSSFNSVLNGKTADLYCEGVDQFSGWFQASLLLSIALNNKSPYKSILVHGFVVDEENRKMSKSLGNIIEPMHAVKGFPKKNIPQCGNDVLRFWVLSEYHKNQIPLSNHILEKMKQRVFEIRSIIRFLTANTSDFDINDKIDYDSLLELDKYLLYRLNTIVKQTIDNYDDMNLNKILIPIENFLLIDVSGVYIKSIKDRLYCESKNSFIRKCAQTVILNTLENCLIMLAPVLPHLTEEAYRNSIFFNKENSLPSIFQSKLNFKNLLKNNTKWDNKNISDIFEILNNIKNDLNSNLKSNNSALYEINLNINKNLIDLFGNEFNKYNWLVDYFGCSNLTLNFTELNSEKYKLSMNEVVNKYPCSRCRRYINKNSECLCDRCSKVIENYKNVF